jgi:hypothetical protein
MRAHLNQVMDGLRGNDHDRTIDALSRIGTSMGYVSKTEFSQPGVRIDLVWYDREGNIQVACEVETSSTWKKDLISTWEVEPSLAIIVGARVSKLFLQRPPQCLSIHVFGYL